LQTTEKRKIWHFLTVRRLSASGAISFKRFDPKLLTYVCHRYFIMAKYLQLSPPREVLPKVRQ